MVTASGSASCDFVRKNVLSHEVTEVVLSYSITFFFSVVCVGWWLILSFLKIISIKSFMLLVFHVSSDMLTMASKLSNSFAPHSLKSQLWAWIWLVETLTVTVRALSFSFAWILRRTLSHFDGLIWFSCSSQCVSISVLRSSFL